jgi:hypothetical protein
LLGDLDSLYAAVNASQLAKFFKLREVPAQGCR